VCSRPAAGRGHTRVSLGELGDLMLAGISAVAEQAGSGLGVVSFGLARRRVRGMADETAQRAATYAGTRRGLAGYRDAVVRAGTDWSTVAVAVGATSAINEGAAMAAALLARTPRPTGLLCMSRPAR
jgi:hypothetical protein